jgi:isopentenyl diphosphate isomerase/L-lactate dehydrogenase-like FMN-dependent dehydrogenase
MGVASLPAVFALPSFRQAVHVFRNTNLFLIDRTENQGAAALMKTYRD